MILLSKSSTPTEPQRCLAVNRLIVNTGLLPSVVEETEFRAALAAQYQALALACRTRGVLTKLGWTTRLRSYVYTPVVSGAFTLYVTYPTNGVMLTHGLAPVSAGAVRVRVTSPQKFGTYQTLSIPVGSGPSYSTRATVLGQLALNAGTCPAGRESYFWSKFDELLSTTTRANLLAVLDAYWMKDELMLISDTRPISSVTPAAVSALTAPEVAVLTEGATLAGLTWDTPPTTSAPWGFVTPTSSQFALTPSELTLWSQDSSSILGMSSYLAQASGGARAFGIDTLIASAADIARRLCALRNKLYDGEAINVDGLNVTAENILTSPWQYLRRLDPAAEFRMLEIVWADAMVRGAWTVVGDWTPPSTLGLVSAVTLTPFIGAADAAWTVSSDGTATLASGGKGIQVTLPAGDVTATGFSWARAEAALTSLLHLMWFEMASNAPDEIDLVDGRIIRAPNVQALMLRTIAGVNLWQPTAILVGPWASAYL